MTVRSSSERGDAVAVEYHDFPTVEWTLHFRNGGSADTPILEDIQALDLQLDRGEKGEFVLHHHVGSLADGNDYGPLETVLTSGRSKRLGGVGGRPTQADWSYFNLRWLDEGWIVAVGWPGQWRADLIRDKARGLQVRAGQEITRFKLLPGEAVRGPLIVLQFGRGDRLRAQNLWRRWMMAHSMPRPGGRLPRPQFVASSSRQYDEMIQADETNQIRFVDRYVAEGLKLDAWWMDAGWYVHDGGGWPHVGTWLVDSNRFPNGLRAVSDHARRNGMKTLVWFEPERVTAGTWPTGTSWSRDTTQWMAWQFDRPETGEGLVQVFRREDSPFESARFPLHGLDPQAQYTVGVPVEPGSDLRFTGRELAETGLPVTLPRRPEIAVLTYARSP